MRILLMLILLTGALPATAEVFRCTDPVTGKTTFTDVACPKNKASKDEIRVQPRNFGANGHPAKRSSQQRAWRSQDPERRDTTGPSRTVSEAVVSRDSGETTGGS